MYSFIPLVIRPTALRSILRLEPIPLAPWTRSSGPEQSIRSLKENHHAQVNHPTVVRFFTISFCC